MAGSDLEAAAARGAARQIGVWLPGPLAHAVQEQARQLDAAASDVFRHAWTAHGSAVAERFARRAGTLGLRRRRRNHVPDRAQLWLYLHEDELAELEHRWRTCGAGSRSAYVTAVLAAGTTGALPPALPAPWAHRPSA